MQLIKCHIENFGKFINFDFNFSGGFNSIIEDNGWGKSTFATFIKAMFYGLPVTTKKDLTANERKKYMPWQGGNYGGNLVFTINQQQYKIERFFGKNKAEDTCTIIDLSTGKKTNNFSENIGVEIFGLDEEAFERSAYIPQKVLETNINASMAQKLTNMIQGTTEDYNYEQAQKRLDGKRAQLFNNKKTGQMQELASQIEDVMTQILELENRGQSISSLETQVPMKNAELATLMQEQNQIQQQINQYGQLQEKRAHQALFDQLTHQIAVTQAAIQVKQAVLERQLLSTEQMDVANDYTAQRCQNLTNYFGGKIPTEDAVQVVYQDVLRYNTLTAQKAVMTTGQGQPRQHRWLSWVLLALALLCGVGGAIVLKAQWILAVALFIVGGGMLLVAGYLSLVHLINVKTSMLQKVDTEHLPKDPAVLQQLQQNIVMFLTQYEKPGTDNLTAINHVMANLREYDNVQMQLTAELQTLQVRLNREKRELEQLKTAKHFDATVNHLNAVDINELQQKERALQMRIDAAREEKVQVITQINQINDALVALDDLENQKANLQSELQTLEVEFNALKSAMKFLQVANESLSAKFLAPMKNGLNQYLTMLTQCKFDNLNLDTDFQIAFEEYGQLREVNYYSQGYQNMFDLCLRFALIDVLYQQEKPFIILDDPFVNLDEAKIFRAKVFLQGLSQKYQLIYFSCHQSRC